MSNLLLKCAIFAVCAFLLIIALPIIAICAVILVVGMIGVLIV